MEKYQACNDFAFQVHIFHSIEKFNSQELKFVMSLVNLRITFCNFLRYIIFESRAEYMVGFLQLLMGQIILKKYFLYNTPYL